MTQEAPRPVVWITRTRDGADRTARAVADLGFTPLVAPVMEIVPVRDHITPDGFDALVVTSGNAIGAYCAMCERRDMTVYCVGDRTAQIAIDNGLPHAKSAGGDVAALFDLIRADAPRMTRLLYAAPRDPAAPLTQWLKAEGYAVTQVTAYETQPVEPLLDDDDYARLTHVLVHSSRAGTAVAQALVHQAAKAPFDTLTFVCISQAAWDAVQAEFTKAGGEKTVARRVLSRISAFPDEASMLKLIE